MWIFEEFQINENNSSIERYDNDNGNNGNESTSNRLMIGFNF